ncbi:MAG: flagellin [Candidatus Puniceispirillaceae bacterium]
MTVINTNTAALGAQYNLKKVQSSMDEAMAALSSGKRINSAADDAAGIAIATRMESQVRGLNQAMRNAADGQSLVATAEGAMDEITNMLQRMRELAIQSANDTNSDDDREALNLEVDALISEIDRVVNTTSFNNKNILDGSADMNFQVGAKAGETMSVSISSLGTSALGSLTGAPSSSAVLTSTHKGVESETTEVSIAFNGNDNYSFNLNLTNSAGAVQTLAISAEMNNSSAVSIAGAINEAIANNATLGDYEAATSSGNVVTIKNTFGQAITLDSFSSVGSGTATYSTINGGASSSTVVNLGGASANTGTVFNTTAANTTYTAGSDATSGTAAVFVMTFDESDFAATDAGTWASGDFGTATAADHLEIAFGDFTTTISLSDATSPGEFATLANVEQDAYEFSVVTTDDGDGTLSYTLKATANEVGAVATTDIPTIKAVAADGSVNADGAFAGGKAMEVTNSVTTPTNLPDGTAGVDAADAVAETGGSKLYLEMLGADTYTFTLDTAAISFAYDGTSANRDVIAQSISTTLATLTDTYSVENANGRIEITNQSNNAMALSAFTSVGSGKIIASTDVADAGAQGVSQVLDDATAAVAASTTAAGTPTATEVDLSFTADDTYSFKISDGVRTAVVDATAVTATGTPDASGMLAAINYGLEQAGMDTSITAAHASGVITLTQAAGREITVSDFLSNGVGAMLADAGTGTTGISRYLDDGQGSGSATVSQIDIETSTGASDAIAIIDRALQDVSTERAQLGAVSNRLDHTISNLGNITISTEGAQSRVEDADFAEATSSLTKSQILTQAATAMLAQANASKQSVLSLLQG